MQAGFQPPAELQETFQNLFKYGNTLGKSPRQRLAWANDLDVPVLDLSKDRQPVEVLWLVGCYPSYYPRNQVVTRAWARIMTRLGVTGACWGQGEIGRRMRTHVWRRRAVRNAGRGEPQAVGSAGIREADHASIRTPIAPCRRSIHVWRVVSRPTLHDVPGRAAGAAAAAGRQADRGHGDVSRQLLRGTALRAATIRRGRCCR